MSKIIDEIRARTGDTRSPEAIAFELGQRIEQENRPDIFETHPDFRDEYYELKRTLRDGPLTTLGVGLKTGVMDRIPEMGFRLGELGANIFSTTPADVAVSIGEQQAFGKTVPKENPVADWFSDQADREQSEAAGRQDPFGVRTFEEVQNPADFANYGARVAGENIPQLALSFIPGAAAGRVAQAARLAEGAAATEAALSGIKAAQATAYLSSALQNTADIYGNLDKETRRSGKGVVAGVGGGALAGALDSIAELPMMSRLFPALEKKFVPAVVLNVLRRGGVQGAITNSLLQAGAEGITETLQEGVAIASEEYAQGREYPADVVRSRLLNAGVGGAILGGTIGGVSGLVPGERAAEPDQASLRPEMAAPVAPIPPAEEETAPAAPTTPDLQGSFVPRPPAYNADAATDFSGMEVSPTSGRLSRLGNPTEADLELVMAADEAAQAARKIINQPTTEAPTELGAVENARAETVMEQPNVAASEMEAVASARQQARAEAIASSYNTDLEGGDTEALVRRAALRALPISPQRVEQVRKQVEARHAIQESESASVPQAQPSRGVPKVPKGQRATEGAAKARPQEAVAPRFDGRGNYISATSPSSLAWDEVDEAIGNLESKASIIKLAKKYLKDGLITEQHLAEYQRLAKDRDMGVEDVGRELQGDLEAIRAKESATSKAPAKAVEQPATPLISSVKYVGANKPLPVKSAPLNALLFTQDDGDNDARVRAAAGSSTVKAGEKAVRRAVMLLDKATGKVYNRLIWADDAESKRPGRGIRIDDSQRKLYDGEPGYKKGGRGLDFDNGDESAPWTSIRDQVFNGQPRFEVLGYMHFDNPQTSASFNFASIDDLQNNPSMNRYLKRTFQPEAKFVQRINLAKDLRHGSGEGRLNLGSDIEGIDALVNPKTGAVVHVMHIKGGLTDLKGRLIDLKNYTDAQGNLSAIVHDYRKVIPEKSVTSTSAPVGDSVTVADVIGTPGNIPVTGDQDVQPQGEANAQRADLRKMLVDIALLSMDPKNKVKRDAAIAAYALELIHVRGESESKLGAAIANLKKIAADPSRMNAMLQMTVRTGESYVSSVPQADAKFYDMLSALQASGINVLVAQPRLIEALTGEAKARGVTITQRDGKALIALAANYQLGTITDDDVVSLYHEGAHPFINNLPEWQQQAYQAAITQLPWYKQGWVETGLGMDARLIANTPREELGPLQQVIYDRMTPEELNVLRGTNPSILAVERAVEHLAALGIDAAAARDVMSQIIRFVKGVMLRIGIELQRLLKGDKHVSPELVRAFVENKWLQFINQDFAESSSAIAVNLKEWIGAPTTSTKRLLVYDNINGEDENFYYDPRTGAPEPISPGTGTTQAATDFIDRIIRDKNLGAAISALTTRAGVPVIALETMTNGIPFDNLTTEQQVKLVAEAQRQIEAVQPVQNEQGQMMSPTGVPSRLSPLQWRIVRTPFFTRWFGDWMNDPTKASKVMDPETGEPRVMYHGTSKTFDEFKFGNDLGFHFGTETEATDILKNNRQYDGGKYPWDRPATPGEQIIPTFLSIRNPALVVDGVWSGMSGANMSELSRMEERGILKRAQVDYINESDSREDHEARLKQALKDNGYDGAVYLNLVEGMDDAYKYQQQPMTFIAFYPEQVKTAYNRTFTPSKQMQLTVRAAESINPTAEANTQFAAINYVSSVVASIVNDPAVRETLPARYLKDGQATVEQLVFGISKTNLTGVRKQVLSDDLSKQVDIATNRPFAFNPETKINELPVGDDGSSAQQKALRDSLLQLQSMEESAVRRISKMRERKVEIEAVRSAKERELTVAERNELDRLNSDIPAFERMLNLKDAGLHDQILRLQGKLQVGLLFDVVSGVDYLVPPAPNAGEESVMGSKAKVPANLHFETPARQEFSRNLGKMQAWLANDDNRRNGWLYETVATQFRKLSEVNLRPTYDALTARFKKTAFDSISNMLRGIGTPQAKYLSSLFYKLEAAIQRHTAEMETIGGKWSSLYDATKRAVKFSGLDDDYRTLYFNRLMQLMAATPDGTADPYNRVIDVFNSVRPSAYRIPDSARPAFRDMMRATVESEKAQAKIFADLGLKVQDEDLGEDADGRVRQRGLIRSGLITGRLSISSSLDSIWEEMKPVWTSTSGAPPLTTDAESLWKTDRKTFDSLAEVYFSPSVKKDFVEPMVYSNKQFFSSIQGADVGVRTMASQANVRAAWNTSLETTPGGDISTFITELNRLEGGNPATEAEMAGQVMRSFRNLFAKVNQISNERAQAKVNGIPTLPREMMNARTADDFPAEWVDYALYDQGSNKVALHSMALNHAFGRDGLTSGEFAKNMVAVSTELDAIRRQYTRYRKEAGLTDKQTKEAMGADRYRIALDWQDHQYLLNNINEKMRYLVNPISTQLGDLRLADELVGLSALGTMQNVRSALVNATDTFGALYRQKFSTAGLKAVKDAVAYTAADGASALLEMFGVHTHFMAGYAARSRDLGAKDPDNFLTWRERMTDYGTGNALAPGDDTQSWSTKTQNTGILIARRAKNLINANPAELVGELSNKAMGTDFLPNVSGDKALAPKLRLMGIFKSSAMWLANGAVYGQYNAYKDMVMRGIEFINKSNSPAEYARRLGEGEMTLDPETLGYNRKWMVLNDKAAWDYMTDAVSTKMNEGSIERMVASAWKRTQEDPKAPIITDEQFARIRGLALSDVQLNAMTTNLPADWRANPLMRSLGVFLSWPYMAMLRFPALFQDAKGRYTMEAAADGMLTMMIPIIPLTLAASMGVDWYDEYLLGKKQNLRDIGSDSLVPGLAPFAYPMATMERMARYGTGGFASEIVNATLNFDDARGGLSADSRVFLLSQLQNLRYTVGNLWQTEHVDYKSVMRPMMQFLGANGVLQYAQLANRALGLNNQESAINERINVGNYLRAVGRDLNLQVLPSKQSGQGIPTKATPFIGQMELAVYQDDPGAFKDAFADAVRAYREEHPDAIDPAKEVVRSFQARHPLRRVFRVSPSDTDYRRILENLNDIGRDAVTESVQLFNRYLLKLGAKPFGGKSEGSAIDRVQKRMQASSTSLISAQLAAAQAAYADSFAP